MKTAVFGVWPGHSFGHHLRDERGEYVANAGPWRVHGGIDGALCPGGSVAPPSEQRECAALLHHRDGWTALAFWDRSADRRHGSNTAFFVEGTHDAAGMLAICRERFPLHFARFTFPIEVLP